MIAQSITEFATYLNEAGYAVTPEKTAECLVALADEDLDILDIDDITGTMRFYFCTTRNQREDLPQHFLDFLKNKERIAHIRKNKEKAEETKEKRKALSQ